MPNRKLTYEVEVKSSGAVSDLRRVGDAGAKAGRDIADGFDQAESASKQAIDALSASMDQLEADAAGAKAAMAAIGDNLEIKLDETQIAGFVAGLRTKFGLAFDDIEADAKHFADVLERGVDMSKSIGEVKGLGLALDTARDNADQSRSVLANMAGNAAQDLGELGGVVGTLGVGIGQLAEYATEGNISLSKLAAVAGPMAGLAAATLLVQKVMGDIAKVKAFESDRIESFTDAMQEGGTAATALWDTIQETGQLQVAQDGFAGIGGKVKDLVPLLTELGLSFDDFQTMAEDPAALQAFADLRDTISDPSIRSSMLQVINGVGDYTDAAAEAGRVQDELNSFLNVTPGMVQSSASAFRTARDFTDGYSQAWGVLVDFLRDGGVATAETAAAMDLLTDASGKTQEEIFGIAQTKLDEQLTADADAATATAAAFEELHGQSQALQQTVDDLARTMGSADFDAAGIAAAGDALQEWFEAMPVAGGSGVQAILDYQDAYNGFKDTLVEGQGVISGILGGGFTDWSPESRAQVAALEELGKTVMPQITKAFDLADGSFTEFNKSVTDISDSLHKDLVQALIESGVEAGDAEDQANALQQQLGLIPENVQTMFDLQGDAEAVAKLAILQGTLDGLPEDVLSEVQVAILADDPQAAIDAIDTYVSGRTINAGVGLNTGPAMTDYWEMAGRIEGNTISAPVRLVVQNIGSLFDRFGGISGNRSAEPAAAGLTATPAAATTGATMGATAAWSPPARPSITVNVTAGAFANRFEVQRAVVAALDQAERLGR